MRQVSRRVLNMAQFRPETCSWHKFRFHDRVESNSTFRETFSGWNFHNAMVSHGAIRSETLHKRFSKKFQRFKSSIWSESPRDPSRPLRSCFGGIHAVNRRHQRLLQNQPFCFTFKFYLKILVYQTIWVLTPVFLSLFLYRWTSPDATRRKRFQISDYRFRIDCKERVYI